MTDNGGHLRRSLPEALPLVSPCPKAPYAMGFHPSMLTYGPVVPGGYSPRSCRLLPDDRELGNRPIPSAATEARNARKPESRAVPRL